MKKSAKPRKEKNYWLRQKPAAPDAQPWEPEKPFTWTQSLLETKPEPDRPLALYRLTGNRLHAFEVAVICRAKKIPLPLCILDVFANFSEDLLVFASDDRKERIRDAVPNIVLGQSERTRIGHSVFSEYKRANLERCIYHEVSSRYYDPARPKPLWKQVYSEVGSIVGLKPERVARIYRRLDKLLEKEFHLDELTMHVC